MDSRASGLVCVGSRLLVSGLVCTVLAVLYDCDVDFFASSLMLMNCCDLWMIEVLL